MRHVVKGMLCLLALGAMLPATAQNAPLDYERWWAGIGFGATSVKFLAPSPAAGRDGVAANVEVGYRATRDFGLGLELRGLLPVGGCREWQCDSPRRFAPGFSKLQAFAELRPGDTGLRLRAGVGMTRFCYERHWDDNGWSIYDTLLAIIDDEYYYADDGSGAWHCDASRRALGGSVSIGYDWRVDREAPLFVGVRLAAEAANFRADPAIGMPKLRHRAVTLTLQLHVN